MSKPSLQHRLNTRLLSGIAVYLVVFSVVLGLLLIHGLTNEFDRDLVAKADAIIEIARQELIEEGATSGPAPDFDGMQFGHFALWLSDGTLVGEPNALEALDIVVEKKLSDKPHFANLDLPDGTAGRKVEIDFVPRDTAEHILLPSQVEVGSGVRTATLVVAESRQALNRQILRLTMLIVGACSVLLISLALLVRNSLRRGLEPVIGLRRQVELLGPRSSVHRVSLNDPPEELAPVLEGINELLEGRNRAWKGAETAAANIAQAS